jgi:MFS family permease
MLADAAGTPIWGKLSDIWGRKPLVLVGTAIFFLGSALSGAAVNIDMLLAGRAVQGFAGGGLLTLVNICISDLFSMRFAITLFFVENFVLSQSSLETAQSTTVLLV